MSLAALGIGRLASGSTAVTAVKGLAVPRARPLSALPGPRSHGCSPRSPAQSESALVVSTPEGAARGSEPRHEAWDHTAAGRRKPPRGPDQALATLKGSVPWSYSGSPALTGPLGAAAGGGLSPRDGHHVRPLHISCVGLRLAPEGGWHGHLSVPARVPRCCRRCSRCAADCPLLTLTLIVHSDGMSLNTARALQLANPRCQQWWVPGQPVPTSL